jgi:serine/threonine-protein kinase HipA
MIERFAMAHLFLSIGTIHNIVDRVADAVMETRKLIPDYCKDLPGFREVGERMIAIWKEGVAASEK